MYGYPLMTFDMMRKHETNAAAPDAEHVPIDRTYPAVDNHCCAAPNADIMTLNRGRTTRRHVGRSATPPTTDDHTTQDGLTATCPRE